MLILCMKKNIHVHKNKYAIKKNKIKLNDITTNSQLSINLLDLLKFQIDK